jgi:xanthine dehydrogenase YagS FAD-binding subunit
VNTVARDRKAEFIAGGTSQVDLMKEGVQQPTQMVDISRLPVYGVEQTASGGLRVGADVKNSVAVGDSIGCPASQPCRRGCRDPCVRG